MSTVNKTIADSVIAGAFPEDQIIAIIRYENIFNGNEAYKLIFSHQESLIQWILDGKEAALLNPTIYWRKPI
jgi:hypothetical protein